MFITFEDLAVFAMIGAVIALPFVLANALPFGALVGLVVLFFTALHCKRI
jgi:hypothetical protein